MEVVLEKVFDHEKLDVYGVAIAFVALAKTIAEDLPRGRAYLADQLQRAATSIVLNIAEGAGERSPADKARFYRFACRTSTNALPHWTYVESPTCRTSKACQKDAVC